MLLSEASPSGEWHLEARIDGESAGVHSFVVTGSSSPTPTLPSAPRPLSTAELYRTAMESTATVEKLAADGAVFGKGIGFWVGDGKFLTAFDVIDGASSLRVILRDGTKLSTSQVLAWNRWQDWTLLSVGGGAKVSLKRGPKDGPNVGDRCAFLEVGPAGAKLADGSISGKSTFPKAGDRFIIASGVTSASFGGPLLDEFGNYVGILGGSILPGGDPIKTLMLLSDENSVGTTTDWPTTGLAVPHTVLPDFTTANKITELAEIGSGGEFLSPVAPSKSIHFISLVDQVSEKSGNAIPRNFKQIFSRRENKAFVFVDWQSSTKEKFACTLRLFDADNKLISDAKSRDVSLAPGKFVSTTWDLSIATAKPGIYRLDLVLNGVTSWREFFRVTE
jgi:S1-C subfamily serine protease